MVMDLNLSLYLIGAIFFVIISRKCFLEKLTIPKAILTFLLSPSTGYFIAYLLVLVIVPDFGDYNNYAATMGNALGNFVVQFVLNLLFMFFYVKLMHARNSSMSVFIYLCSLMLVPSFMTVILSASLVPFFSYLFLQILFYVITVRPASELTRERQVTNASSFIILPALTYLFNSSMYALLMYLFNLTEAPDNLGEMLAELRKVMDPETSTPFIEFLRGVFKYVQMQQDMILYPSLFVTLVLIIAFSIIVRNIKYMNEALRAQKEIKELSVEVMEALAHTIDAKDEYTKGHSIRVAKYSKMIAERMGLSEEQCENIYYMGLLHDLGKIGVPNEIINKPSRLTEEEYDVIKGHPGMGSEILAEIKSRPDLVTGARWHHERYDGTGYPDHKKGEDIPLEARIIAVADTYDAMTSNRSYRNYLTQDRVREELVKNSGTQFDGKVAGAMLEIMNEDKNYELHE